jgi:carbonic anhydrase
MSNTGTQQSPIRIVTSDTLAANFPQDYFALEYADADLPGTFNGHDFEFSQRTSMTFRGLPWNLTRIHIHQPAEHRVDNTDPADYECHLVHFAADDETLSGPKVVVGIYFHKQPGAPTPLSILRLNAKLAERRAAGGLSAWSYDEPPINASINPNDFLPADRSRWFHYEGSLTGSPYSEDVSWFVFESEIAVDPAQTADLEEHAEHSARPVESINRRFVLRSFST